MTQNNHAPGSGPEHLDKVYRGQTVEQYDEKRRKRKKWKKELDAVQKLCAHFDPETSVLDVPLGTGRFVPIYREKSHRVYGLDISLEMLARARGKMTPEDNCSMMLGQAQALPFNDDAVDYVVCIRLLNWASTAVAKEMIREFSRVARHGLVLGFRHRRAIKWHEWLRMFAADCVPTPTHLLRWARLIRVFGGKVVGKTKKILGKPPVPAQKGHRPGKKPGTGSTFHDMDEISALFSQRGVKVEESIYIDAMASYWKGEIRPYSIYRLGFDGAAKERVTL